MEAGRVRIDRRALMVGGAAVAGGVIFGALGDRQGWWDIDLPGGGGPDDATERLAVQAEAVLVRAYDEAIAGRLTGDPATVSRLTDFRADHLDHLAALGGGDRDIAEAPPPGWTVAPDTGEPAPHVPTIPAEAADLPWYFAEQEDRWAQQAATASLVAVDGELARLLALVAASETTHVAGWRRG